MNIKEIGKKTFHLIVIVGLLLIVENKVHGQMRQVYLDAQADNQIYKLSFYSPSQGYVAFANWIGYTTDSGRTFTKKYITIQNVNFNGYSINLTFGFGINGIKAFDKNTIIAYGDYGLVPAILYSTNGGDSYTLIFHSQFNNLQLRTGITDMIFPQNDNIGYAVDADRILKTTNKGLSWSVVYIDAGSYFDHLEAPDNTTLFAMSTTYETNKLLKSTNGGNNWQTVTLPNLPSGKLVYAHFLNANTGWLDMRSENDFYFYKTSNGGVNWVLQSNLEATPFYCSKMKFIDENIGYALAGKNLIFKTFNSGVTWEPLSRDNDYVYLGYTHNDIQCVSAVQLWAGGGHGFLEMSNNGGGIPIPQAYFRIDTTGIISTEKVNLLNYSRTGYNYQWFLNNTPLSNQYNASYTHNPDHLKDTITLIVSNGTTEDTLTKYEYFFQSITVSSFSPAIGSEWSSITIKGAGFSNATSVSFGGVPSPSFSIISDTQINAYVGKGASGNIVVSTPGSLGTMPGFTYKPPLTSNLPTEISDSILCKSERISVNIKNSQNGVRYELMDSLNNSFGFVNSLGGAAGFITSPISVSGTYKIKATDVDVPQSVTFTNKIFIKVEHTRSLFNVNKVNAIMGEKLNFNNHSPEATNFKWSFNEDASLATSSLPDVINVSYASAGQKTLSLISTSSYGCSDTLTEANAVFIYNKPSADENCYALNVDDSDFSYYWDSPSSFGKVTLTDDNGYLICGYGNKPLLKSRFGKPVQLPGNGSAYFAKYTSYGALSWYMSIRSGGHFYASEKDNNGDIYILGSCKVLNYLKLPNGDSLKISSTSNDVPPYSQQINGFILKVDAEGNYLWHTVIDDPSREYGGYPVQGGLPKIIKIQNNQIIIKGDFLANLAYYKDGNKQNLISLQNSTYSNDLQNNFIFKIKTDGTLVWNMYFENNSTNQRYGISGIGIDNQKNCYFSGYYEEQVTIHDVGNANNFTLKGNNSTNRSFLLKFDSSGHFLWKTILSGIQNSRGVLAYDLATDSKGATYITGSIDGGVKITNSDTSVNNIDFAQYFLAKFNSDGVYKWSAGSKETYYGAGYSIYLKGANLYSTGFVSSIGYSDTSTFKITSTDGTAINQKFYGHNFFISEYDTTGVLERLVNSGGNYNGNLQPNNLILDNNQNFIISGMTENFSNTLLSFFDTKFNSNGYDGFFGKLNPDYCTMAITPLANAGANKKICPGDTTSIGGPGEIGNYYCWTSKPDGFSSYQSNPTVSPTSTTVYYLSVTNNTGIIAKDSVSVIARSSAQSLAGANDTICSGSSVKIGSTQVAGNQYSWTSAPAGFTSNKSDPVVNPVGSTQYFLSVSNDSLCAGKDTVAITVNELLIPTVTIAASDTNICSGTTVTFEATVVNGGSSPVYHWRNNGVSCGTDSINYSSNSLQNADHVSVTLNSSEACALPATVTSNVIGMSVNAATPSVIINGLTNLVKDSSTLISSIINSGGTSPSYQWEDSTRSHSWREINGAISPAINYIPANNGDKIRCLLTSNENCAITNPVVSNILTFTVTTPNAPVSPDEDGIKVYPNPVGATITIDSLVISDKWETLQITSISGMQNLIPYNIAGLTKTSINVEMLQKGMYIIILRRKEGGAKYIKFIKL